MELINHKANDQRDERLETLTERPSAAPLDLEDFYCMLQANPYDSLTAMRLAHRLEELGRLEEALKVVRGVIKMDSRFETVFTLARLEYQLEMDSEAFTHLQEALLIAPGECSELFEIFKTLGNIFVRRGDFDSAEDSYNKAHRLKPDSDVLLVNLGTLCVQRQEWDLALERFRTALSLNIGNDKAWIGLAICHRTKGDFELAWGNLEAALEYNPLNDVALTLALNWGGTDKESRVREMLRAYLVLGGWNEEFSLAFAWLSWRRGETNIALCELERLLAVNPGHARAIELHQQIRASL